MPDAVPKALPDTLQGAERARHPTRAMLLCLLRSRACALPTDRVNEVMRPLPLQAWRGMHAHVLGLALVRGRPTPVLDLAGLLGLDATPPHGHAARPARWVSIKARDEEPVVLAVTDVLGVQDMPVDALRGVPTLAQGGEPGAVAAVGVRHRELMVTLDSGHLLDEATWRGIADAASAAGDRSE